LVSNHHYYVIVYNACGKATSGIITVTIANCSQPVITSSPASLSVAANSRATLSVTADGTSLLYQWYKIGSPDKALSEATLASYQTPALTEAASYYVKVTNSCGSAYSATAVVTICVAPAVTAPTVAPVTYNHTATITVSPTGTSPFSYSWFRGQPGDRQIPVGTNSASLQTQPVVASVHYWVHVINDCGAADSAVIVVPVALAAPINVVAAWSGGSVVNVQWTATPGGDHYTVERW